MENIFIKLYCSHHKKNIENIDEGIKLLEKLYTPIELCYQTTPDSSLTKVKDIKREILKAYKPNQNLVCILHSHYPKQDLVHLTIGIALNLYEGMLKSFSPPPSTHTIDIHLKMPQTLSYIKYCYQLLQKWASITNCFKAEAITSQESDVYAQQRNTFGKSDHQPPYDLPDLSQSMKYVKHVLIPYRFTWINYWSQETAAYMDWSDDKASLFYKTERTQNGGLMLQLTEQPTTMERVEHQDALRNAYLAFPKVGGRYWAK